MRYNILPALQCLVPVLAVSGVRGGEGWYRLRSPLLGSWVRGTASLGPVPRLHLYTRPHARGYRSPAVLEYNVIVLFIFITYSFLHTVTSMQKMCVKLWTQDSQHNFIFILLQNTNTKSNNKWNVAVNMFIICEVTVLRLVPRCFAPCL